MFIESSTFFGMSARSFSLSFGMMMVLMPARCAASTFSFTPPIGRILPRSVISPVIATSVRTGTRASAETSAVARVMPADGPSFGIAPSGTWMWTSVFLLNSFGMPSSSAFDRTQLMAACADSCMTSPSLPVSVRWPRPGMSVASVTRISPPTSVHANPVATPISSFSSAMLGRNRGTPRYSVTFSGVMPSWKALPCTTTLRATLRQIEFSSRSRLRTPASRV